MKRWPRPSSSRPTMPARPRDRAAVGRRCDRLRRGGDQGRVGDADHRAEDHGGAGEIARQTDLLALNAARGSGARRRHGRGFACSRLRGAASLPNASRSAAAEISTLSRTIRSRRTVGRRHARQAGARHPEDRRTGRGDFCSQPASRASARRRSIRRSSSSTRLPSRTRRRPRKCPRPPKSCQPGEQLQAADQLLPCRCSRRWRHIPAGSSRGGDGQGAAHAA